MEDFIFGMSHRMLHTKWLYQNVHKVHHQHIITVGIAGQYAHPIEYLFGNLVPTIMAPFLLQGHCHMFTATSWFAFRDIENIEGHSGYEFPFSPFYLMPFGTGYGYHAFHHSENVGNYHSFFTTWDTIFGSNKVFYNWVKEQENEDKERHLKTKQD